MTCHLAVLWKCVVIVLSLWAVTCEFTSLCGRNPIEFPLIYLNFMYKILIYGWKACNIYINGKSAWDLVMKMNHKLLDYCEQPIPGNYLFPPFDVNIILSKQLNMCNAWLSVCWQSYFQFFLALPWFFQAQFLGIWRVLFKLNCIFSYISFFCEQPCFFLSSPHQVQKNVSSFWTLLSVKRKSLFTDISVIKGHTE